MKVLLFLLLVSRLGLSKSNGRAGGIANAECPYISSFTGKIEYGRCSIKKDGVLCYNPKGSTAERSDYQVVVGVGNWSNSKTQCESRGYQLANFADKSISPSILQKLSEYEAEARDFWIVVTLQTSANPCVPNPCLNGGVCSPPAGTCTCVGDWLGRYCDQAVDVCSPNPCLNNGVCVRQDASYVCQCAAGFEGYVCQKRRTFSWSKKNVYSDSTEITHSVSSSTRRSNKGEFNNQRHLIVIFICFAGVLLFVVVAITVTVTVVVVFHRRNKRLLKNRQANGGRSESDAAGPHSTLLRNDESGTNQVVTAESAGCYLPKMIPMHASHLIGILQFQIEEEPSLKSKHCPDSTRL